MTNEDSIWECVSCSHYNRVELKECENCGGKRMVKITGEVPNEFFKWFDMMLREANEEEKKILSQVDIRVEE